MSKANDPKLRSWVNVPANSDFPIQNLPFGIFTSAQRGPRVGVAIGEHILDLNAVAEFGYFDSIRFEKKVFSQSSLNAFIALGKTITRSVRERISELLDEKNKALQSQAGAREKCLVPMKDAEMLLPGHLHGDMEEAGSRAGEVLDGDGPITAALAELKKQVAGVPGIGAPKGKG